MVGVDEAMIGRVWLVEHRETAPHAPSSRKLPLSTMAPPSVVP